MSIQVDCTECGQRMVDGVLQHTKECSANNFKPVIGIGQMPPGQTIHFDTPEEQKAFMYNLKVGSFSAVTNFLSKPSADKGEGELKKYWWHAGRWHIAECPFVLYDEGVCNCDDTKNKAKLQSLLIEAENRGGVRELTRLDNQFDEVTPDRFHQYYLDRIKQLTTKQEGKL